LVADGTSDRVLLPILTWSLKQHDVDTVMAQWADLSRIHRPPDLRGRLKAALDLYPCDVLFVHRDSEGQPSGGAPKSQKHSVTFSFHSFPSRQFG
jgi:hypothetical protein